ncbi:hypothetical protein CSQ85_11845 [Bifidobacterium rousetti]|nr:hypothetical protein CSQ85_11845 [Bifidobacterium rousetti]PST49458.1 hypothetical protein COO72_02505 [Bifidobacterium callitrichos]
MKHSWYCPNCGQPLVVKSAVDNATARTTWSIRCLNPRHFSTGGYPDPEHAEEQLEKALASC